MEKLTNYLSPKSMCFSMKSGRGTQMNNPLYTMKGMIPYVLYIIYYIYNISCHKLSGYKEELTNKSVIMACLFFHQAYI